MSNRILQLARQGLLCSAVGLSLGAEAPRLGFQTLGSWPTGSMKSQFTAGSGYGAGAFAEWELDAGRALRLAYDGVYYPTVHEASAWPSLPGLTGGESDQKCRSHSVTLQYLYFPRNDTEGFYFLVGLGGMAQTRKTETSLRPVSGPALDLTTLQETGVKLACVAGLGYEFSRSWGVTARYSFITVENHTLGAVQAGISYRF